MTNNRRPETRKPNESLQKTGRRRARSCKSVMANFTCSGRVAFRASSTALTSWAKALG
jgi:hypothetical protein